MTDDDVLPNWVYEAVIEMERWADEHSRLYQQNYLDQYVRTDACGCAALDRVPATVREQARLIRRYQDGIEAERPDPPSGMLQRWKLAYIPDGPPYPAPHAPGVPE